ncbi:MAG: hypothetical protein HC945_04330 [Nitrosarchaeum sp.]|nr:hypothetical protein [Nitrosarchaeum sp.]
MGKSSLLRMFRLHCKRETVPVGLASGDDAKSAVEVLVRWSSDLKVDGIKLSTFIKTAEHYRAIQGKVEEQVHKARETRDSAARTLGKAAAKTVVETAVSTIPVVGPLISELSGTGAEALVDWLGSFLNKPDIDLLLDPVKALTADFLADITTIAPQQRLVLILDTFEQMTALEEWTRDLAQQLHQNVLLVIAGRAVPNWSRKWPGWMSQAEVQELRPMTGAIMRELVSRYYATMRGGEPNSAQVEAILNFARGLPIVVTSAVQLWVQYGVEDFQTIKPQVMADLVDRLQEGVSKELTPVLEAAAAVRWFNNDILRAVTAQTDVSVAYDELRRFPFTRPRVEGLSLHTAMREIIDDNLRIRDPARHRALHERAATYFEAQLAQTGGLEAEQFELELLYHRVRANEALGMQLFQKIAEDLARYRLINRLSILLNDTNTYQLERENSRLWREYYNARLAYFQVHLAEAEQVYQRLSEYQGTELKLRTYVLCDWGELLSRYGLQRKDGIERANEILKQSLKCGIVDAHLSEIFFSLGRIARHQGQWDKENEYYEKARNFFEQKADNYILVGIYLQMKSSFGHRGLWQDFFLAHKRGVTSLSQIVPEPLKLKAIFLGSWTWSWALAGRATEAEQNAYESLAILDQLQDDPITLSVSRDLGWILGAQGRFNEAYKYFYKSLVLTQKLGESHLGHQAVTKMFWGVCLARAGQLDHSSRISWSNFG